MKQKEYLILFASVLIVIIMWVIFNIYHNYTTNSVSDNENYVVVPIDNTFDQNTINQIKNRKRVEASLDSIETPSASPSPTIAPTPTIIASPSPSLSPSPTQ